MYFFLIIAFRNKCDNFNVPKIQLRQALFYGSVSDLNETVLYIKESE